jgi:hypothetical protein
MKLGVQSDVAYITLSALILQMEQGFSLESESSSSKNSMAFMEPEASLPCSKDPTT